MINLLPPQEKQNLLGEKNWKISMVLGVTLLTFLVSFILILVSINFSISTQAASEKAILDSRKADFNKTDAQDLKDKISKANKDLTDLDAFYKQTVGFTDFLIKISSLLPEKNYLENVSISPVGKNNSYKVSLSAKAPLIEDVIKFNDNLKKDQTISNIVFPRDTWLKKSDIVFKVDFQIELKK